MTQETKKPDCSCCFADVVGFRPKKNKLTRTLFCLLVICLAAAGTDTEEGRYPPPISFYVIYGKNAMSVKMLEVYKY